jgi:hypothetical protein
MITVADAISAAMSHSSRWSSNFMERLQANGYFYSDARGKPQQDERPAT